MKNLENYGVLEMNAKEISETDGGWLNFVLGAIVGGLIYDGLKWAVLENNAEYGAFLEATSGSRGGM